MNCLHPFQLQRKQRPDGSWYGGYPVPCGYCINCRNKKRSEWMLRIKKESETHQYQGYFITLTYSPEHLPLSPNGVPTLKPVDPQLWLKRLRKRLYGNCKGMLRYYLVGEYGGKTHRPHYHLIVWGVSASQLGLYQYTPYGKYYTSDLIYSTWGKGFVTVGSLTEASIAYVAGYVNKKRRQREYASLVPEYNVSSLGLGKAWLQANESKVLRSLSVQDGPYEKAIPRYYRTLLKLDGSVFELAARNHARRNYQAYNSETGKSPIWELDQLDPMHKALVVDQASRVPGLYDSLNDCYLTPDYLEWITARIKARSFDLANYRERRISNESI